MQFTNFVHADGQFIATRLARHIAATHDSLKKAIAKFNRMPADTYEGCLYHLPQTFSGEEISNLEELTSVEINCMTGKSVVPMETYVKAIQSFNFINRAEEEESILHEEVPNVFSFCVNEHNIIEQFISTIESQSPYERGCLNLHHHHLLFNELTLTGLSQCTSLLPDDIQLPLMKFPNLKVESYSVQDIGIPEPAAEDFSDSSDSSAS